MEKIAENDLIVFYKENEILFSEYKEGSVLNLENAKKVIALRHEISKNKNQYWIQDITKLKSVDKEARDIADIEGQDLLFAAATLVGSHITKFMFNTYLKLKKPKIPFQVFAKREDAIKWLLEIKAQNEKG